MNKVLQLLLMISFVVLGSVTAAQAANYYVDSTSGSDSNSGTSSAAPWQSLGKVNSTAFQAGDTVNFNRGSVWTGVALVVNSSGVSGNPVTYQAYGIGNRPEIVAPTAQYQESITVTGDWNVIKGFLLRGGHEAGIDIAAGADHNTIEDNEITNAGLGVRVRSQFNLLTKNYVHDLTMIVNDSSPSNDYGAVCFWVEAPDNEISYNRGINCRAPSIDFGFDGGFVEVWQQGDNVYVHHNYAENTAGFFELGAGGNGSAQNVKVVYNVIVNPKNSPGVCFNTGAYNINIAGFVFDQNTFYAQSGNAGLFRVFGCRNDLTGITVRNNIFYSDVQIANNGNFTHTNNLYHMVNMVNGSGIGYSLGSGEMTGSPLFVNVGAGDFHLQSGSPAIGAGLILGYTSDFEGNPIPVGSAPDLGAYQYGLPPAPPTQLRQGS